MPLPFIVTPMFVPFAWAPGNGSQAPAAVHFQIPPSALTNRAVIAQADSESEQSGGGTGCFVPAAVAATPPPVTVGNAVPGAIANAVGDFVGLRGMRDDMRPPGAVHSDALQSDR